MIINGLWMYNKSTSKKQAQPNDYKWVYNLGLVSLIVMAVVGFQLAVEIMDVSVAAWTFSLFVSLSVAFSGGLFWLAVGCVCLYHIKRVSEDYRADLAVMGVLNIAGIFLMVIFPILYHYMLVGWVLYYGVVFGWLFYRSRVRKAKKARKKTQNHGTKKVSA